MSQAPMPDFLVLMKQRQEFQNAFLDVLLSREDWSGYLGFHRATLWRWETRIISTIPRIEKNYYKNNRKVRSNYLDAYQRFVIALISLLMARQINGAGNRRGNVTSKEVKKFLVLNYQYLSREGFEKWREANV